MNKNQRALYDLMGNFFYDCELNGASDFECWCENNLENEEQEKLMYKIQDHVEAIAFLLFEDKRHSINSIDDIVCRLNDGLDRTEEELKLCKKWLLEYQTGMEMSLNELDEMCYEDSNWVFEQIFG